MVVIIVSDLLYTTNCSMWREDSSGDRSYEVGDDLVTNWKTYSVAFLHNPLM